MDSQSVDIVYFIIMFILQYLCNGIVVVSIILEKIVLQQCHSHRRQHRFIVMAHFRSGTLNPDGNWSYSLQSCIEHFMQQYPDEMIEYDIFKQHKCRLVNRIETKNCICKGKSTGRPTVLTENVIENIQERINRSPKKAASQLSQ
ncbi:hypothetical protein FQA39_LY12713 [Lamprigera yunnana]|nr:hypothetical protein FQA39_LY12713 [Lamprigera yunnana]